MTASCVIAHDAMILNIHQLSDVQPTPVRASYDGKQLDLEFSDLYYSSNISLSGSVERSEQSLTFRGELHGNIEQLCNRCLERVRSDVTIPFDLTYAISGQDVIDTTPDLRDLLILNHPEQFLCSEGCKGICAHCGKNLNHETCQCKTSSGPDASWTPLKKFLKKGKP